MPEKYIERINFYINSKVTKHTIITIFINKPKKNTKNDLFMLFLNLN